MKITVLANRDVASNLALNHLLPTLHGDHSLRVYLSSKVGGGQALSVALASLKFFEQTLFNELLFPALGSNGGDLLSFEGLGRYTEAPIEILNRVNSDEGLEQCFKILSPPEAPPGESLLMVEIEILGDRRPARLVTTPLFDADAMRMRG